MTVVECHKDVGLHAQGRDKEHARETNYYEHVAGSFRTMVDGTPDTQVTPMPRRAALALVRN